MRMTMHAKASSKPWMNSTRALSPNLLTGPPRSSRARHGSFAPEPAPGGSVWHSQDDRHGTAPHPSDFAFCPLRVGSVLDRCDLLANDGVGGYPPEELGRLDGHGQDALGHLRRVPW